MIEVDSCYIQLAEIAPLVPEEGGRQLLYEFLNDPCEDTTCSVHGFRGLSLPILRQSDLPDDELVAFIWGIMPR
jgi:hypothetical protein